MRGRKGQFYLLAAIIIITLIVGFVVVSNYSSRKSSVKLYDLGEELGIESQNVLDYGTYNSLDEGDMNELWERFIENYVAYAGENKNLYFIFGDPEGLGLQVVAYQDLALMNNPPPINTGDPVVIRIEDVDYEFDLILGQNFYFVVSQEIEGEKYIVTG